MAIKKVGAGDFSIDAQYRIPNTEDELKKFKVRFWDSDTILLVDVPMPHLPRTDDRVFSIVFNKKDLKKLMEKI